MIRVFIYYLALFNVSLVNVYLISNNYKIELQIPVLLNVFSFFQIKRLKLLEQEKDFLLQGLDVVDRARNWYLKKISNVSDKLERVSKWDTSHSVSI